MTFNSRLPPNCYRFPDSRLSRLFSGGIPIVLDTLKQHYFIDRYPWMRLMKLIVSDNVKKHILFSTIIMVSWKMVINIFISSSLQRWRNVPAHLKLYADWPSNPPRELHQRGTLAGGGKVLRASWSVLSLILRS